MNDERSPRLRRYLIAAGAGLAMALVMYWLRGGVQACATTKDTLKLLADVFTIPGVMLILFSGLVFVSGEGIFDGISFAMRMLVRSLIPGANLRDPHERYGDYVMRRRGERKKSSCAYLLITGGVYLAIAIVFTVLYYRF